MPAGTPAENIIGSFFTGEVASISATTIPTIQTMYSQVSQGFVNHKGSFQGRGGLKYVASVTASTSSSIRSSVPLLADGPKARVFAYNDLTGAPKALYFRFGAKQDNAEAYETYITGVDLTTGTKSAELLLQASVAPHDSPLLWRTAYIVPDKLDLVSTRDVTASTGLLDFGFYVLGGRWMLRLFIDEAGGVATTKSAYTSHPYAMAKLGGLFGLMAYSHSTEGTINSHKVIQDQVNATNFVSTNRFTFAQSNPELPVQASNIISLGLGTSGYILKNSSFAGSWFLTNTVGLHMVVLDIGKEEVSGVALLSRQVSTFLGQDVQPQSMYGSTLIYVGEELRTRDITLDNLTNVNFAGDQQLLISPRRKKYLASAKLNKEDVLLYLTDTGTIDAVSVFKLPTETGEVSTQRGAITFFVPDRITPFAMHAGGDNLVFLAPSETEGMNDIYKYASEDGEDTFADDTTGIIEHKIVTPRYAYAKQVGRFQVFMDLKGGELTGTDTNNIYWSENGMALVKSPEEDRQVRGAGGISLRFSASLPPEVTSCIFAFEAWDIFN